ncbi:RNA polymerase sigma factor [Niallia sp. 03133]|uniref:RNA polymerase sigma factor n=1 Tax=Niallia sp. 03133 TaxID=3458060 RepID=UPI004044B98F
MNKKIKGTDTKAFHTFIKENKQLMENQIVKDFLETEQNYRLFAAAVNNPTKHNKDLVDQAFKKHYFTIRFTSYLSTSIYFKAINFHNKQSLHKSRYPLLLDAEIEQDGKFPYKNQLEDKESHIEHYIEKNGLRKNVAEYVEDPLLYKAIQLLTKAQKNILYYAYVQKLNDTEIALLLKKSQQYISKTHKEALKRVYQYLLKNGGNEK